MVSAAWWDGYALLDDHELLGYACSGHDDLAFLKDTAMEERCCGTS